MIMMMLNMNPDADLPPQRSSWMMIMMILMMMVMVVMMVMTVMKLHGSQVKPGGSLSFVASVGGWGSSGFLW